MRAGIEPHESDWMTDAPEYLTPVQASSAAASVAGHRGACVRVVKMISAFIPLTDREIN